MAAVDHWFYHLTASSVLEAVPPLLEKSLGRGWHVEVISPKPERLAAFDAHLWSYRDDGWLPHGTHGAGKEQRQPILLSGEHSKANAPAALVLLDGAETSDLTDIERVMVVFDGRDEAALTQARAQWRSLQAEGHLLSYWQQENGAWVKKV
jgi:DNA polymerase III subunit chi